MKKEKKLTVVSLLGMGKYTIRKNETIDHFYRRLLNDDGFISYLMIDANSFVVPWFEFNPLAHIKSSENISVGMFKNCVIDGASKIQFGSFINCEFVECIFRNMSDVRFRKSRMMNCEFIDVDMASDEIYMNEFDRCKFTNVGMLMSEINSKFVYCEFHNTSFKYSIADDMDIDTCTFDEACILPHIPMSINLDGEIIGWKVVYDTCWNKYRMCKLLIPAEAKRCRGTGWKCRCSSAKVLELQDIFDGKEASGEEKCRHMDCQSAYSLYPVSYEVGKTITSGTGKDGAPSFDDNRWNECSCGIHFFTDRDIAVDYMVRSGGYKFGIDVCDRNLHPNTVTLDMDNI